MTARSDSKVRAVYQAIAEANGWTYSPAHGGWVHDDEIREGQYQVQASAEDACWLHDLEARNFAEIEAAVLADANEN